MVLVEWGFLLRGGGSLGKQYSGYPESFSIPKSMASLIVFRCHCLQSPSIFFTLRCYLESPGMVQFMSVLLAFLLMSLSHFLLASQTVGCPESKTEGFWS